jgi:glycosyltransferase involved in cell wall biosynthesis
VLVIAHPEDDEARIVDTFDAGLNAAQGDTGAVVDAIRTWTENPDLVDEQGRNARAALEAHFTKQHSVDRYYALLSDDETLEPDPVATWIDDRSEEAVATA